MLPVGGDIVIVIVSTERTAVAHMKFLHACYLDVRWRFVVKKSIST